DGAHDHQPLMQVLGPLRSPLVLALQFALGRVASLLVADHSVCSFVLLVWASCWHAPTGSLVSPDRPAGSSGGHAAVAYGGCYRAGCAFDGNNMCAVPIG